MNMFNVKKPIATCDTCNSILMSHIYCNTHEIGIIIILSFPKRTTGITLFKLTSKKQSKIPSSFGIGL